MTTTWTVIVCGGVLLFAVVGLILLGLKRRSEEKEFALDGPQDFDDEPCCCHPSYTRDDCPLGFDDPDPVHGHPAEASAADEAKLRGDWERIGRDMERALGLLGIHDDGKPVESTRPLDDDDRATDGRYQREVLGIWPSAAKPKPRTRYYVSPTLDKADGREVDKAEYVRVERSQGFRNTLGFPDEPATSSFGGKTACGWTVYDTGATRTPWTDPNREVEQADDRGTTAPQPDFDDEYWAKIPEQWRRS